MPGGVAACRGLLIMEWMILPYKRYFDFSGRSRRKEYWLFTLLYVLVILFFLRASWTPGLSDWRRMKHLVRPSGSGLPV